MNEVTILSTVRTTQVEFLCWNKLAEWCYPRMVGSREDMIWMPSAEKLEADETKPEDVIGYRFFSTIMIVLDLWGKGEETIERRGNESPIFFIGGEIVSAEKALQLAEIDHKEFVRKCWKEDGVLRFISLPNGRDPRVHPFCEGDRIIEGKLVR